MIKHFNKILVCLLFFISCFSQAQINLVPNPSFEIKDTCPNDFSQMSRAKYWISPTLGTSDYYNQCCPSGDLYVGVPANALGFQNAVDNDSAYAGLIAFEKGSPNYREYIQGKLTNALAISQKYYITMYVSLTNNSKYATDDIGIHLSKSAITRTDYYTLNFIPQVENLSGHFLSDTINWMKISASFTADSSYQYITIGNFKDDSNTDTMNVYSNNGSTDIYYYVDDLCISTDSLTCNNLVGIKTIINNQSLFFYNTVTKKIIVTENGYYNIEILDLSGHIIEEMKLHGSRDIDISKYEYGYYIVGLKNEKSSYYKKIIINP
jgi:OmpA-OmpF porin, OOP family